MEKSGNEIVNEIYEYKLATEERGQPKEDMDLFIKEKYQDFVYFSKPKFEKAFPSATASTHAQSHRWYPFGSRSDPSSSHKEDFDEDKRESSVRSLLYRTILETPKRGVKKALSGPSSLEAMRRELGVGARNQDGMDNDESQRSTSSFLDFARPFNPFSLDSSRHGRNESKKRIDSMLSRNSILTKASQEEEEDKDDDHEDDEEDDDEEEAPTFYSWEEHAARQSAKKISPSSKDTAQANPPMKRSISTPATNDRRIRRSSSNSHHPHHLGEQQNYSWENHGRRNISKRAVGLRRGVKKTASSPDDLLAMRRVIKKTSNLDNAVRSKEHKLPRRPSSRRNQGENISPGSNRRYDTSDRDNSSHSEEHGLPRRSSSRRNQGEKLSHRSNRRDDTSGRDNSAHSGDYRLQRKSSPRSRRSQGDQILPESSSRRGDKSEHGDNRRGDRSECGESRRQDQDVAKETRFYLKAAAVVVISQSTVTTVAAIDRSVEKVVAMISQSVAVATNPFEDL